MFRFGSISVLCSTSTLAIGVNLPAHLVIIRTTQIYNDGKFTEYNPLDIQQMMGRAGRPQYDSSGTCIIITGNEMVSFYKQIAEGALPVKSQLDAHWYEIINSEIVTGLIKSEEDLQNWLEMSLLKNQNKDVIITPVLNQLVTNKLTCLEGLAVKPSEKGRIVAKYFLTQTQWNIIEELIGDLNSLPKILVFLSKTYLANHENTQSRSKIPRIAVRFPTSGKANYWDKIFILLQCYFEKPPKLTAEFAIEMHEIVNQSIVILRALIEYFHNQNPSQATVVTVLRLMSSLNCKAWFDSKKNLGQFPGIGDKNIQTLAAQGLNSATDMQTLSEADFVQLFKKPSLCLRNLFKLCHEIPVLQFNLLFKDSKCCLRVNCSNYNKFESFKLTHLNILIGKNNQLISWNRILVSNFEAEFLIELHGLYNPIEVNIIYEELVGCDRQELVYLKANNFTDSDSSTNQSLNSVVDAPKTNFLNQKNDKLSAIEQKSESAPSKDKIKEKYSVKKEIQDENIVNATCILTNKKSIFNLFGKKKSTNTFLNQFNINSNNCYLNCDEREVPFREVSHDCLSREKFSHNSTKQFKKLQNSTQIQVESIKKRIKTSISRNLDTDTCPNNILSKQPMKFSKSSDVDAERNSLQRWIRSFQNEGITEDKIQLSKFNIEFYG